MYHTNTIVLTNIPYKDSSIHNNVSHKGYSTHNKENVSYKDFNTYNKVPYKDSGTHN